eukprot:3188387-Rhodomonas_salina.1
MLVAADRRSRAVSTGVRVMECGCRPSTLDTLPETPWTIVKVSMPPDARMSWWKGTDTETLDPRHPNDSL